MVRNLSIANHTIFNPSIQKLPTSQNSIHSIQFLRMHAYSVDPVQFNRHLRVRQWKRRGGTTATTANTVETTTASQDILCGNTTQNSTFLSNILTRAYAIQSAKVFPPPRNRITSSCCCVLATVLEVDVVFSVIAVGMGCSSDIASDICSLLFLES
jgi:hypothetical protein